jgi:shikimate dehydrogenase
VTARTIPWGEPLPGAVIVNATPLGMSGERLPPGLVEASVGICDLAYGPAETPAVTEARGRGLPVVDGIEVLVAQAARSFWLWTGREPPIEVMRQAASQAPQG